MIYEMVNNCLDSLIPQWEELAEAFQHLAQNLDPADPNYAFIHDIGNPDPNAPRINWEGLQLICADERDRLDGVSLTDLDPIANVLSDVIDILRESSRVRTDDVFDFFATVLTYGPDPQATDSNQVTLCRTRMEQLRAYITRFLQQFEEIEQQIGQRVHISGIRSSVDKLASYPVLAAGIGGTSAGLPALPGSSGEGSLRRTVEGALREVLGRTPRISDPRSFVASLNQSFQLVEVEGRTEVKWTKRGYAGQSELGGGVSGAQASLYKRAQATLDNALPLLDGLSPLLPDPDEELVDASRAIVRSQLTALVHELGTEGGPRLARVDRLIESLLHEQVRDDSGQVLSNDGYLGYLRHVFGLQQSQVNTLEEEVEYTNFLILEDYTESLEASWIGFRQEWEGRDLGTRLVLLSRALSVTAETVAEVQAAMDSVYVGEAERQVASFADRQGREILISDLLGWVESFCTDEARHLIEDGGRRGVGAMIQTAGTLVALVGQFIQTIPYGTNIPDGLRHPRVERPLHELQGYLQQVLRLSQSVWQH